MIVYAVERLRARSAGLSAARLRWTTNSRMVKRCEQRRPVLYRLTIGGLGWNPGVRPLWWADHRARTKRTDGGRLNRGMHGACRSAFGLFLKTAVFFSWLCRAVVAWLAADAGYAFT